MSYKDFLKKYDENKKDDEPPLMLRILSNEKFWMFVLYIAVMILLILIISHCQNNITIRA